MKEENYLYFLSSTGSSEKCPNIISRFFLVKRVVRFDENGIRTLDVYELKLLQYRTTHINGASIFSESFSLSKRLGLVEVAYLDDDRLKFLAGHNMDVWPGISMHTHFLSAL